MPLEPPFFLLLGEVALAFLLLLTAVRGYGRGVHVFSIRAGTSHLSGDNFIMFSILGHNLISGLHLSVTILQAIRIALLASCWSLAAILSATLESESHSADIREWFDSKHLTLE